MKVAMQRSKVKGQDSGLGPDISSGMVGLKLPQINLCWGTDREREHMGKEKRTERNRDRETKRERKRDRKR